MIAADKSAEHVLAFCRGISDCELASVPLLPLENVPLNECFPIVREHVLAHGGQQLFGWAIWEWPKVFIEAEFHSVWQSPEGQLIDITPKPKPFDYVTFLLDSKRKYGGRQINNIRKPLCSSLIIRKFIDAHNEIFRAMNKGDLAHYHGEVLATPELLKLCKRVSDLRLKLIEKFGHPPA